MRALETALGQEVVVPRQATSKWHYLAGSPEERADALMTLLTDNSVGAIICTAGGFNSAALLPLLSPSLVRDNPKLFVGYSDCTALLTGLQAIGNWLTYHGPCVLAQMGEYPIPHPYTVASLSNALRAPSDHWILEDPLEWTNEYLDWRQTEWLIRARQMNAPAPREVWKQGVGEGQLFGGNIETLNMIVGTEYFAPANDIVLLIEATRAEAYLPRVRRSLTHLEQAGIMRRVRALLIGRSPDASPVAGESLQSLITEQFTKYSFPIVANLPFGHTDPVATLPLGARTRVTALSADECSIQFNCP